MTIVINFKNYKTGKEALDLAKAIKSHLPNAIICPPTIDLQTLNKNIPTANIYAQHTDGKDGSKTTGFTTPENLKQSKIDGTIVNHSEHRLEFNEIKRAVRSCKEKGIKTIVCVSSITEADKVKKLSPYAIAFEEPNLISTGNSITTKSKKLERFVKLFDKTQTLPLCGAGISKKTDVEKAYEIGCQGVLIASAISKPKKAPEKLLKQLKEAENSEDKK
ncbi:MAG: triose-phosphate isomerase [Candidatus Pacearchaeota archaeon]